MRRSRPLAFAFAFALAGCFGEEPPPPAGIDCASAAPPPPDPTWRNVTPRLRMETTKGTVTFALHEEQSPTTVSNVLDLAASGVLDGTRFHRVAKGFVIQGGDPNSKDADPTNDGLGGPGYAIPDEFHPALRHDAEGVLSMANAGPDTGGSQFFVTLARQPQLDDRHAVFGRVEAGFETIRAIAATPVDEDSRPLTDIILTTARAIEDAPVPTVHETAVTPVLHEKKTEAGRPVTFAVVVRNLGTVRDAIAVRALPPDGWSCRVDRVPVVPAGTARVVFLTLTPPEGSEGKVEVPLLARSAWLTESHASVNVTLGPLGNEVRDGSAVVADYAGILPDGRVFDTSLREVAEDDALPKFVTSGGFQPKAAYEPFRFTVGAGVIPGFSKLALSAREGETVTALVPKEDAYTTGNMYEDPLTGRDLVFELRVHDAT